MGSGPPLKREAILASRLAAVLIALLCVAQPPRLHEKDTGWSDIAKPSISLLLTRRVANRLGLSPGIR
jgi:hypothetical protein